MLKRSIEIEIPIRSAVILSGPDPRAVLSYLRSDSRSDFNSPENRGVFEFRLLFPSKRNGGRAHIPEILPAKIFIDGNSGVHDQTCDFSGFLLSLGNCKFEAGRSEMVRIDYLAGTNGGECVGEICFECSLDNLFSRVANESIRKVA